MELRLRQPRAHGPPGSDRDSCADTRKPLLSVPVACGPHTCLSATTSRRRARRSGERLGDSRVAWPLLYFFVAVSTAARRATIVNPIANVGLLISAGMPADGVVADIPLWTPATRITLAIEIAWIAASLALLLW